MLSLRGLRAFDVKLKREMLRGKSMPCRGSKVDDATPKTSSPTVQKRGSITVRKSMKWFQMGDDQ